MNRLGWGLLAVALGLGGCDADTAALRDWMAQQRQTVAAPALPPLAAPLAVSAVPYRSAEASDPFDARRLDPEAAAAAPSPDGPPAAELGRPREPLEAYPLESLRMVGSLVREGRTLALVQAPGALFTVRPGDRLGTSFGLVTHVTENAITLREQVRDAAGAWTPRNTMLELQETPR